MNQNVYLTQTDTIVGFVSQNADKLTAIKKRPPHKHYIKAVNSLRTLKTFSRIPNIHKNHVRRAKKTTFIVPNGRSFRVIYDKHHLLLINRLTWAYTSSANLSGEAYDETFAKSQADVIIEPLTQKTTPSSIYRLSSNKAHKIR